MRTLKSLAMGCVCGTLFMGFSVGVSDAVTVYTNEVTVESALDIFSATRTTWNDFTDAGGLNSSSNYHGIEVSSLSVDFTNDDKLKGFSMIVDQARNPPKRIREALGQAFGIQPGDWKVESGSVASGKATYNNLRFIYLCDTRQCNIAVGPQEN